MSERHETEHKSFGTPDEMREFPRGHAEILEVGGGEVGRLVFEPGWRWAGDLKPIVKTDSCEAPHFQYHVSGQLAILMDDGTELVAGPGDSSSLPSGHDAWVVGDEPAVVVDWYGASNYARGRWRRAAAPRAAGPAGSAAARRPAGRASAPAHRRGQAAPGEGDG